MPLYKQLFDASPDAQLLVNCEGLIQEVNKHAQTLFGYGYEELVGQTVDMLIPKRFSANHHSHRENYQKNPRTRPMGVGMNLYGLHKNGHEIPVDVQLSPIGAETLCVVRDVSATRKAEEKFNTLLEDNDVFRLPKRFATVFVPLCLLVIISASFVAYYAVKDRLGIFSSPQAVLVNQSSHDFLYEINSSSPKLLSLAYKEPRIQTVIDHYPDTSITPVLDSFSTLLTRNPSFLQMRWIGEDGFERVRITSNDNGGVVVADTGSLQDKSDRYYTTESLKLRPREIYISPLDLNVENGIIEQPHQPVVRLGARVYRDDGTPNGFFIINVSVRDALKKFAAHSSLSQLFLLNADGYWLSSPSVEDQWGFMYGNSNTFASRYAGIWSLMNQNLNGQLLKDVGLWTWQTIQIPVAAAYGEPQLTLKTVSLLPADFINRIKLQIWGQAALLALIILTLLGYVVWKLTREYEWRQRSQARLARTVDDLTRRNQELDEFAYIASHDLKEPLRGIHNYANFLYEDYSHKLEDEGKHFLSRIQHLAERQTKLLSQLLEYSRIGQSELSRSDVDLNRLLKDVRDDLASFLAEAGVHLTIHPLPVVNCNEVRIQEVFQNLIVNAAKYNDNDNKQVEVGVNSTVDPPVFFVQDNGIGIPPKHQDVVFRIFKRLHEQEKFGGGSGAGLTIVKKIIEKHGGRIWLKSTPGEGTTFFFTLREANDVT